MNNTHALHVAQMISIGKFNTRAAIKSLARLGCELPMDFLGAFFLGPIWSPSEQKGEILE